MKKNPNMRDHVYKTKVVREPEQTSKIGNYLMGSNRHKFIFLYLQQYNYNLFHLLQCREANSTISLYLSETKDFTLTPASSVSFDGEAYFTPITVTRPAEPDSKITQSNSSHRISWKVQKS